MFAGLVSCTTGELVIEVLDGAWQREIDREGNVVATSHDPSAKLWANIGDRLILANSDLEIDEIAGVEVLGVEGEQGLRVRVVCGALSPATSRVHVLPARKARAPRSSRHPSTKGRGVTVEEMRRIVRKAKERLAELFPGQIPP